MIAAFLKYLSSEKRTSSHTVLAYETDLRQLDDYLKNTYELQDSASADHVMIRSWIVTLSEAGLSPTSINRKIACLRSYFKYLLRQEVITRDPMQKIRVLKTSKKLPSFVKEQEMSKMLDHLAGDESFEGLRTSLILELFYGTGIRLSELLHLKEANIDTSNQTIKVLGKRNKERVIPFSKPLIKLINAYKKARSKEVTKSTHGLLFVTHEGDPCYPALIYRIVKEHLTAFTNSEKTSPHVLRHTYATHLLNRGAEINAVKDLLGHTSLAATQVYTHNTMDKLKKVFKQAHPKA
jgi:integrase/recombinase XerC